METMKGERMKDTCKVDCDPEPEADQAAGLVHDARLGRIEMPFEQQDRRIGMLENALKHMKVGSSKSFLKLQGECRDRDGRIEKVEHALASVVDTHAKIAETHSARIGVLEKWAKEMVEVARSRDDASQAKALREGGSSQG